GRRGPVRAPPDGALLCPAHVQGALGAGERDVQKPELLGLLGRRLRVHDRDEPRLYAGDEHGVELEALGAMEAEELDGVGAGGVVTGSQCGLQELEEARECAVAAVGGEVVAAEAAELLDVLTALLRWGGDAGGERPR